MNAAEASARARHRQEEADSLLRGPGEARDRALQREEESDRYVRALLREREGYVLAGKTDRVAQVDAEVERAGKATKR